MKVIIGIKLTLDLEDIIRRFMVNPVQRLTDCLKVETWIEKKR